MRSKGSGARAATGAASFLVWVASSAEPGSRADLIDIGFHERVQSLPAECVRTKD